MSALAAMQALCNVGTRVHLSNDHNFELGIDCVLDGISQHLLDPTPR